jgi:hypothetical protein
LPRDPRARRVCVATHFFFFFLCEFFYSNNSDQIHKSFIKPQLQPQPNQTKPKTQLQFEIAGTMIVTMAMAMMMRRRPRFRCRDFENCRCSACRALRIDRCWRSPRRRPERGSRRCTLSDAGGSPPIAWRRVSCASARPWPSLCSRRSRGYRPTPS